MNKVPSLLYTQIVHALQRDGWTVVRQRGSHSRLHHPGAHVSRFSLISLGNRVSAVSLVAKDQSLDLLSGGTCVIITSVVEGLCARSSTDRASDFESRRAR